MISGDVGKEEGDFALEICYVEDKLLYFGVGFVFSNIWIH